MQKANDDPRFCCEPFSVTFVFMVMRKGEKKWWKGEEILFALSAINMWWAQQFRHATLVGEMRASGSMQFDVSRHFAMGTTFFHWR